MEFERVSKERGRKPPGNRGPRANSEDDERRKDNEEGSSDEKGSEDPRFRRRTSKSSSSTGPKKSGSAMGVIMKDCVMLARSPFGGSLVILTPFWRMDTGKSFEGYDVSQRRNSAWARSGEIGRGWARLGEKAREGREMP